MPFANSSLDDFDWCKPLEIRVASPGLPLSLEYTAHPITTSRSHFLEVSIERDRAAGHWHIDLVAVGADGERIEPEDRFSESGGGLRMSCAGARDASACREVSLPGSGSDLEWLARGTG